MIWTAFIIAGLAVTFAGAAVTASAVFVTEEEAFELSGSGWGGGNPELKEALLKISRHSRNGLIAIAGGTAMQMVGTAGPLIC